MLEESNVSSSKSNSRFDKPDNSKKYKIIGGVVSLFIIIGVVLALVLKKSTTTQDDAAAVNQMKNVFMTQPDLSKYARGGKDKIFSE